VSAKNHFNDDVGGEPSPVCPQYARASESGSNITPLLPLDQVLRDSLVIFKLSFPS
jgi:hypothetical protein